MISLMNNYPPLLLPYRRKTKEWRRKHLEWANSRSYFNYGEVRRSVLHKKINYDLLNGVLHMKDLELTLNPHGIQGEYLSDDIQHYPIMNSKLNVLRGEEFKRIYDFYFTVTNPTAITEKENNKKDELNARLLLLMLETSLTDEEFELKLEKINHYFTYEWQDQRELRANALMQHYWRELDFPIIFNNGIMDVFASAEELYLVDIIGGEPTLLKLNPMKVRAFRLGYSTKIEDADIIIIEDFRSPSSVIDEFYDVLSDKDVKYIENITSATGASQDGTDNYDERRGFILLELTDINGSGIDTTTLFTANEALNTNMYQDGFGNIRVLKMFWKSRRKIKKVKYYNSETGEEEFDYFPEDHKINKDLGEEELSMWINEAWEGTMIGEKVFVNMRPRPIQYNRISNPSRCHFGIIGLIYSLNEQRPFSMVDMMKPYNYMYDAVHNNLNDAIAANWGSILEVDLANVPLGWTMDKWLYYAKVAKIAVKDSFKEGNSGVAKGKIAGGLNNASRGMLSTDLGNYILLLVNTLEFIKMEMAEVAGISRQREGLVSNRETVGGIERATLQSSHITEWLFMTHDNVKKRVLEAFIETAKIALRGRKEKFLYILPDSSIQIVDIDGDVFAEADYGIVADNSPATQTMNSKIETYAQAALLNLLVSFSTVFRLLGNASMAEKLRMIEADEASINLSRQLEALALNDAMIEATLLLALIEEMKELTKRENNIRDNETKVLIELMRQFAGDETSEDVNYSPEERLRILSEIKRYNDELELKYKELAQRKIEHKDKMRVEEKKIQATKQRPITNKTTNK